MDKNCDTLVGSLNAGLDKMSKIQTKETKKKKLIEDLAAKNRAVIKEIFALQKGLQLHIKFNEDARKEIIEWKAKRKPKTATALKAATCAKLIVGVITAARIFLQVAGVPVP